MTRIIVDNIKFGTIETNEWDLLHTLASLHEGTYLIQSEEQNSFREANIFNLENGDRLILIKTERAIKYHKVSIKLSEIDEKEYDNLLLEKYS
jgi:hypothetical protein